MQFIVIARDHKDPQALERRLKVRPEHIALGDKMRKAGTALTGVVLLNEAQQMNGSVYIVDFNSREDLDTWLQEEPYIKNNVWDNIEIIPCKVGPSFIK